VVPETSLAESSNETCGVPSTGATSPGATRITYRPSDDDGPGTLATAYISITDTPPVANDDTASTDADTAVTIDVLANDTDADNDTLTVLGASDGIYGTTTVNVDGTVTYTPAAGFTGTDWFNYVIDDGYGRLSYATVTVVVAPGTVTGRVWNDLNHNGIQDGGIETGFGGPGKMDPIGPEPGIQGIQVWLLDAYDTIIATTWTNSGGEYSFTGVAPGQYKVRVATAGYIVSPKDQGLDDAIDSDISSAGYSDLFTVAPGGLMDIDAGLYTV
jgi:Big-like domain-containing protein/SdrD B-like protein